MHTRALTSLLPIVVHPLVDWVFSNYMCRPRKIVQVYKQSMYRFKHAFMVCLEGVEQQSLLEGL